MKKRTKLLIVGGSVLAIAAGGATVAAATGGFGDDSHPITGHALDTASAAALKATHSGTVTETEVGDEESYYEVEVTKPDGSQVDVQLDRAFNPVGQSADSESGNSGAN
jgi:uncharacterized membrane protein YkoI